MQKIFITGLLVLCITGACKKNVTQDQKNVKEVITPTENQEDNSPFFKLSLAQWSLHKAIQSGELNPIDFAQKAKELGFEGIEYVNQLYNKELEKGPDPKKAMQNLLETLKAKSEAYTIENLIIMVDGEGDLAVIDQQEQDKAVENHKKWVDAAQFLGCHSIRVNLFGNRDPKLWHEASVRGLQKLSDYAVTKNINIIVENHGWLSSNASLLAAVMKKVNRPNCGTLPDFGNFCLEVEEGKRWGNCLKWYPRYQGVEEMMPYAKAVSAKSHDFDSNGNETKTDYKKMLEIIKKSGYTGFIGVEYEGELLGEIEGIKATRDLLISASKQIN